MDDECFINLIRPDRSLWHKWILYSQGKYSSRDGTEYDGTEYDSEVMCSYLKTY